MESHNCISCILCIYRFVCKWLYTCLVQSVRVLNERDFRWMLLHSATTLPAFLSSVFFTCTVITMCTEDGVWLLCLRKTWVLGLTEEILSSFCCTVSLVLSWFLLLKLVECQREKKKKEKKKERKKEKEKKKKKGLLGSTWTLLLQLFVIPTCCHCRMV